MEFSFGASRWLTDEEIGVEAQDLLHKDFALGLHIPRRFDRVLDLNECHLQSQESAAIVNAVRAFAKARDLTIYSTFTQTGYLRNLVIRETRHTDQRMVNIVTSEERPALMEEFRYGADGSFQSGTFADYLVPTACEVPEPVIVHLETPSPFTPLGAKGLGEGNNMSTPVVIANAFADALRPLRDLADVRLPLMPSRVLSLIGEAGGLAEPAPPAGLGRTAEPPRVAGGLALQAQGSVDIAAPPEKVFAVLLDPAALARVIPGCHALQRDGEHRYRADVTVRVGLAKARYEARVELPGILLL